MTYMQDWECLPVSSELKLVSLDNIAKESTIGSLRYHRNRRRKIQTHMGNNKTAQTILEIH